MHKQQAPLNTSEATPDALQIDFMDIAHDLHQQQSESKKKEKARRRSAARRAIENRQEQKRLESELREWWQEI